MRDLHLPFFKYHSITNARTESNTNMHLINAQDLQNLRLEEHIDQIPPYVILSHTWGDQEVSFQEMAVPARDRPESTQQKAGYLKIMTTCRLAQQRTPPIHHVWIDTCCIDKTSSAHLTENINSMYEFYTRAEMCVVYLVDLPPHVSFRDGLKDCKWISRGWTLQEMIAASRIEFFSAGPDGSPSDWKYRGTKSQFCNELAQCTGVPRDVLNGRRPVASYSIAQRMSWASRRKTTRPEDIAYCLLGIFGVNMPLIYGEREVGAFRRLQENIIKKSNDMTIFAWEPVPSGSESRNSFCSIFAPSPANFQNSSMIGPWAKYSHDPEYTLTNKGLRMEEPLYYVPEEGYSNRRSLKREYVLALGVPFTDPHELPSAASSAACGSSSKPKMACVGVYLRKIGPDLFMREARPLKELSAKQRAGLAQTPDAPFYVLTDDDSLRYRGRGSRDLAETLGQFREKGLRFLGHVSQVNIVPQGLWDSVDRCFLPTRLTVVRGLIARIRLTPVSAISNALTRTDGTHVGGYRYKTVEMGVLMNWCADGYTIRLFDTSEHENLRKCIFSFRHHKETKEGMRWRELEEQYPEIKTLDNKLRVHVSDNNGGHVVVEDHVGVAGDKGGSVFIITASAVREQVEGFYQDGQTVEMYRFALNTREETPGGSLLTEQDGMDLLCKVIF
ncbi:hypothetical protein V8F20_006581 [Naviculisporaceae sp. PSN 640]